MRRRFFVDGFEGSRARLEGESARHLGRALRAEPGQLYELSNGADVWLARIERVERGTVEFTLVEQLPSREPGLRVTLLLSIVKFDRFEWCLEKATELGVCDIVPLASARCENGLVDAAAKRAARWEKILFEAAQQARRLRPPRLHRAEPPRIAFAGAGIHTRGLGTLPIILSERESAPPLRTRVEGKGAAAAILAIGPEGGWTDQELDDARAAGYEEASLGMHILRTETAVIASLANLNFALAEG